MADAQSPPPWRKLPSSTCPTRATEARGHLLGTAAGSLKTLSWSLQKGKKETKSKEEVLRRASCNSRAVGKRAQGYDMSVPLVALWRNLRNAQSWFEYHTQCLFFPACYKFSAGVISGPTRGIPAHPAGKRVRSLITGRVSNDLWKDEDQ